MVRQLNLTSRALDSTLERISSGRRINRSADDAALSAVADNLAGRSRALQVANRNANQGVSLAQIADGATGSVTDVLKRLRELAVQASSETLNDDERAYVHSEHLQLVGEIDRVAQNTNYAEKPLANGTLASIDIQVGAGNTANDRITIQLGDLRTVTLGVDGMDMSSVTGAQGALATIDDAIGTTLGYRSQYGASSNRLEHAASYLETEFVATTSAQERIVDADFAYEASEMARLQLAQQAGLAALGQAAQMDRTMMAGLLQANRFG
jgi:flagellin